MTAVIESTACDTTLIRQQLTVIRPTPQLVKWTIQSGPSPEA
jgi:hypothetical protein